MSFAIVLSLCLLSFTGEPISPQVATRGIDDYLAYWPFDEGSGTQAYDQGPHEYKADLIGVDWTGRLAGHALSLDGIDDYAVVVDDEGPPDEIGDLEQGSISVWFMFRSNPPTNRIHPVFYLGGGEGGAHLSGVTIEVGHFGIGGEGQNTKLYFTVYNDSGPDPILCFDSSTMLELRRWYHFVAVVGPDYNTGYLNGKELVARFYNFGSASDTKFFADVQDQRVCWLGRGFFAWIETQQYYDGHIDDLRIFDRPLEADEVREYYDSIAAGDADGNAVVGFSDLLYVLGEWGSCPDLPEQCYADLNNDGLVNIGDLLIVLANWA